MKEQQNKKEKKQMKQRESSTFEENIMSSGLTDSIFDWDGLLHRLMGDEDLAKEIVDDFLKQIPFNFTAVKEALNKQDVFLVKREAHIIKGASGNVGALALQEIAGQIEIAGEEKDLVKAGSFVAELDTQLEILKNKLTRPKG
ncbi:MAG: Hpt domain-containing protein [Desulfobacteraceae bacterium]|nr:Hpt domain-containing protein [Desulfobacteraceae bacterium]